MSNVKVVIGANFGDEGKGLMTDYFCYQSLLKNESCIVVLSNGGAQRGHTVTTPDGIRHVFHHFGSGTFSGADSYFCDQYILNPMTFRKEYEELQKLGYNPKVYAHRNCMWSTPYDMIINQIIEDSRGDTRHGSCGMGIWETILRYNYHTLYPYNLKPFNELVHSAKKAHLVFLREVYFKVKLETLKIKITSEWESIFNSDVLIDNFIDDVKFMCDHITWMDDKFLNLYDNVIFENGQGLLLDQNNIKYGDNTTPSNTGIKNPHEIISKALPNANVEVCYVTRTYLTRHGAGRFDEECSKDIINASMEDYTNVPNPYQGAIRYGWLDVKDLLKRIKDDISSVDVDYKVSLAITHANEHYIMITEYDDYDFIAHWYVSDDHTRHSVKFLEKALDK